MDQYRNNGNVRVGGADTGPLAAPDASQSGGQPTTYVPPEVRPQGSVYPNYAESNTGTPQPPAQPTGATQTVYRDRDRDRRLHRSPVLGPLLLISAGVVFLLNNLGVLPWGVWETLGRLWPLFLIAIGVDLIVGRRNPLLSLLIVVAVVGAGAALVYANDGFLMGRGGVMNTPLNVGLNGATSANVHISMDAGTLTIGGMSSNTQLAAGNLEYFGNNGAPIQNATKGQVANLELSQRNGGFNFGWFSSGKSLHWDVNLNKTVPTDLKVEQGAGNVTLDLSQLQLKSLNFDAGTGNSTVTLPSAAGYTSVDINGGVGNTTIIVPDGVLARLELNSGIGNTDVDSRFQKQGESTYVMNGFSASDKSKNQVDIKLDHGVGNVDIRSSASR